MKLSILDIKGKESGSIDLPENIFSGRINTHVLHQAIVMYQACQRQGTASTKERACVNGGGKKPYRQKGTGRARAGSTRSPLWKGGGVTFGPHPRDFDYSIPKRIKKAALRESLHAKFLDKNLVCVNDLLYVVPSYANEKIVALLPTILKFCPTTTHLFDKLYPDKSVDQT